MQPTNRRSLFALTAAIAAGASLPAVARPLDQVLSSKRLRVGINPTLPPFGTFNERNQIDGFDADIAREIARRMNVELEIVQVGSPDRIPFLQSDRIDIVLGAITRTIERALVIDYTQPLHTQSMVVLTKASGTAVPIAKPADLNNRQVRMVQVRGTVGVPWLQAHCTFHPWRTQHPPGQHPHQWLHGRCAACLLWLWWRAWARRQLLESEIWRLGGCTPRSNQREWHMLLQRPNILHCIVPPVASSASGMSGLPLGPAVQRSHTSYSAAA